ncbi:unnamed protein product, partial [Brassica rapa]
ETKPVLLFHTVLTWKASEVVGFFFSVSRISLEKCRWSRVKTLKAFVVTGYFLYIKTIYYTFS